MKTNFTTTLKSEYWKKFQQIFQTNSLALNGKTTRKWVWLPVIVLLSFSATELSAQCSGISGSASITSGAGGGNEQHQVEVTLSASCGSSCPVEYMIMAQEAGGQQIFSSPSSSTFSFAWWMNLDNHSVLETSRFVYMVW